MDAWNRQEAARRARQEELDAASRQPFPGGPGRTTRPEDFNWGSGALEVVERCGQAEWLVQDERAAVHVLDHVPPP